MSELQKRKFPNLKIALAIYDEEAPKRDDVWNAVNTNEDADKAAEMDLLASRRVQYAFYLDTHDINRIADCYRVHVQDLRKYVTEA